jgi:hypothetical protein
MTNPAESPRAATDSAFAETCIIAKPTSCFISSNNGDLDKNTDSDSPIAPATDDASPFPKGSTLPNHMTCGQPSLWTEAEEKRLAVVVVTCGEKNWVRVASMMPNRSKASCRRKWILTANGWTLKEDIPLREAVTACGEGNWDEIAARMPGRTALACQKRWAIITESYNNGSTMQPAERLPWSDEEEKRLVHAVLTCGIGAWDAVDALILGRSGVACREKWKRMMGSWSPEEDLKLVEATKVCGEGNWKDISRMVVPRRTIRQCCYRSIAIHAVKNRNSVVETVPCRTEVSWSRQSCPWTDAEIKRLVHAVKTYGEWGEWTAIAAMVPNRSEAECRSKWTSATPVWTPEEDMLLAVAVKACEKGDWLQVAARVPGRTRMACFNRWTLLVKATRAELAMRASQTLRTSADRLPLMSGRETNPGGVVETCISVGVVETCGKVNGAAIATQVPDWINFQRRIKRQRIHPSVPNQPKGLLVNMTAARPPPFPSVNNGAWVPYQLLPRTVAVPIFQHFPSNPWFSTGAAYRAP